MEFWVPFLFFVCFAIVLVAGFAVIHAAKQRRINGANEGHESELLYAPPLPGDDGVDTDETCDDQYCLCKSANP